MVPIPKKYQSEIFESMPSFEIVFVTSITTGPDDTNIRISRYKRVNPLILTATKSSLTLLMTFCGQKHSLENN